MFSFHFVYYYNTYLFKYLTAYILQINVLYNNSIIKVFQFFTLFLIENMKWCKCVWAVSMRKDLNSKNNIKTIQIYVLL